MPPTPSIAPDAGFVEVADRCWVARHELMDVNVGVVAGEAGVLVVDTHASEGAARAVLEQVRRLGVGEVVAVVNTHQHLGHTSGNAVFAAAHPGLPVIAHDVAAAALAGTDPSLVPSQTVSSARAVDLGDRQVELVHPGRGHTAGDVVVRVPDADVLWAGDLVEESVVRGGVPGFGADCFPVEWPATLDLLISLMTSATVVVPGHGQPVDRDFAEEQRTAIGVVAETVRDLVSRHVPEQDALASADWPYPREQLVQAVRRAYAQLPRPVRTLPLV